MNETVTINIYFTDAALRQVNARYGDYTGKLEAPSGVHLVKGDVVEFAPLSGIQFAVLGRVVKFTGHKAVTITYLLDLCDPNEESKLRAVGEGQAPEK